MKWLLIAFFAIAALVLIGGEILHVTGDDKENR